MMSNPHTTCIVFDFNGVIDVPVVHEILKETLEELSPRVDFFILSRMGSEFISTYLQKHSLLQYFHKIHAVRSSDEKAPKLGELQQQYQRILFVTDSAGDIAAAQEVSIPTVGVTWGFDTTPALTQAGATHIAKNPETLRALLLSAAAPEPY